MRRLRFPARVCVWAACVVLISTGSVHAYIDPGTGSYILQIVIAGLIGAAFTLKLFWKRLTVFISSRFSKNKDKAEEDTAGEDG